MWGSLHRLRKPGVGIDIFANDLSHRWPMPLNVADGAPTLFLRREAYERIGLTRAALDERLGLTADEFRVEGDLIAVGPIYEDDALQDVLAELETLGLAYFDDFFELTGNWPAWLIVHASARPNVSSSSTARSTRQPE